LGAVAAWLLISEDPFATRRVSLSFADADGKPTEVTYVRGPEAYKEAAIESARKRRFDIPKFLFEAFQAKTVSLRENVVAPR